MTIKEQIEILQAYERGDEIEFRKLTCDNWNTLVDSDHQFNFYMFKYRIKPKWWRAKREEYFYLINYDGNVGEYMELCAPVNDMCYDLGNYFRTKKDAEKAKCIIKDLLTKFHEAND